MQKRIQATELDLAQSWVQVRKFVINRPLDLSTTSRACLTSDPASNRASSKTLPLSHYQKSSYEFEIKQTALHLPGFPEMEIHVTDWCKLNMMIRLRFMPFDSNIFFHLEFSQVTLSTGLSLLR